MPGRGTSCASSSRMPTSTTCSAYPLARQGSIRCSAESFAVQVGRRTIVTVGFGDIVRATAFKRDEITTDLLCVAIAMADGRSVELHEEIDGFDEWMRRMEALDGFKRGWRGKVIH